MPPPERPPPRIAVNPCVEPGTTLLVLSGTVRREDLPALVERVRHLLQGCAADRIVCDVGGIDEPDAATIDALARLQLAARRRGHEVSLLHATPELEELVSLVGLDDALPPCAPTRRVRPQSPNRRPATHSAEGEAEGDGEG